MAIVLLLVVIPVVDVFITAIVQLLFGFSLGVSLEPIGMLFNILSSIVFGFIPYLLSIVLFALFTYFIENTKILLLVTSLFVIAIALIHGLFSGEGSTIAYLTSYPVLALILVKTFRFVQSREA